MDITSKFLIPICNSYEEGNCKKRLDYYVERSVDEQKLIVELAPCPFYENEKCKLSGGHIGFQMKGYPAPKTYEKRGNELTEIERPHEIIFIE